ncbi:hypothetical protein L6R50_06685 [Myxococcota bacterium]|nr:hypothetical protein [Myxococcota bacterium]
MGPASLIPVAATLALALAAGGCDLPPPPDTPLAGLPGGDLPPKPGPGFRSPPAAFRELERGPHLVEALWGPGLSEAEVRALEGEAKAASLRESALRRAVRDAAAALERALAEGGDGAGRAAAAQAFVGAERALAEEQAATAVRLLASAGPERLAAGLRMGYPPVLADLLLRPPADGAGNPFARLPVEGLGEADATRAGELKRASYLRLLETQQVAAGEMARLPGQGVGNPGWQDRFARLAEVATGAWAEYRTRAVEDLVDFVVSLPPDRRAHLAAGQGVVRALCPAEGASGGDRPGPAPGDRRR